MTHVLVVDDEPQLLRTLVLNLSGRGYQVTSATSGHAAVTQAVSGDPDVVLLDLGLPDIDGTEVITRIRAQRPGLPIVVLSARTGSQDKVAALDLGAVDYVTKPFDLAELLARLRAAGRRGEGGGADAVVHLGPTTVDLGAHLVTRGGGGTVHLTPTEWRMLEALLRRPGVLVTGAELLTAMRGAPGHTERSYLRIYMQQLRRKLEPEPARPRYLLTEPGMGYRYVPA